jgi:photosystem II stability/assembly factor-like uncharacterized protein
MQNLQSIIVAVREKKHRFLVLLLVILFAGCEAPLNLEGVEQERKLVSHRFDQFQAVASHNDRVVLVGSAGTVLTSDDGGHTWQRINLDASPVPSLVDVSACGDGHFVALAMDRKVWVADAEAQQWQAVEIPTMEEVLAIECREDNSYWVTGSFTTVLSSTDGGANWQENSLGEDAQLTTIQFINNEIGYAGGEFGIFIKTLDGGATWDLIEPIPGDFYPQGSYFRNENEGWAVGLSGGIFHTIDGGVTWNAQDSNTAIPLYGIDGNDQAVYAVGESGVILRNKNNQWAPFEYEGTVLAYLRGVAVSSNSVIIAGGNGASMALPLN